MHMICYLPPDLPSAHPVRRLFLHAPSRCTREIYDSIAGLHRRLARPGEPDLVLALAFTGEADLDQVLGMAQFCLHRDILLILPRPDPALQAKAHRLRPRFMTCLEEAAGELSAVLHRLTNIYENNRGGYACSHPNIQPMPREPCALKASF